MNELNNTKSKPTPMKKLAHFFNYIEEHMLIRYGRRIWQVIGFLSILAFVVSLFLVVRNLLPTSRKEVHISKQEYKSNKVDRDFDESNNIDACTKAAYKKALDSLKKQMPLSEWVQLTKSESVTRYREVYRYDPWYGSYSTYEPFTTFEQTKNYDAIPVILEGIFSSKGIDSTEFCDQIKVLRAITALMKQTQKSVATMALKETYRYLINYNDIQKASVDRAIAMYKSVNGKKPFVVNPDAEKDPWQNFSRYLYTYSNTADTISQTRDEIARDIAIKLKKKGIKKPEHRNNLAIWVLQNEMDDDATQIACTDLFESRTFKFNEKNFIERVNKYLVLYIEKYRLAETLKAEEEAAKAENVELYGSSGLASFGLILAIASTLILYSIRQILKDKKD
jgi:hypothetical protein